ncbi:hypothetical protein A2872_01130 [Candidatus Gottesmanbacteria bacterium RIFCSPHIGHO2_01_FULL_42_12]|uniref:Uncharacterized protein n=1 Tax=Candidatus Gottesmanbacteria bacterium RIFCSPHIGHO2_01_FULL_42_12 TaxID=1798377 RepID=A0A1F5Z1R6_9BACT|nr:MAG: hypothetical protein A2872_01130 [Candidatus Gottesmanbacteria bacterium RIFCSPHIGHO2_01_FULL_42_12]
MIADGGEIILEKKPIFIGKPLVVILIVVSVFVLAVGIGIGVTVFSPRKVDRVVTINPEPNIVTTPNTQTQSKFVNDSAFLRLKSDIAGFASELDRIDLTEPQLAPPNINLNIKVDGY